MIRFNAHISIDSVGLDRRDFATPKQYEADTQRVLFQITHSRTGAAVTRAMAMAKKNLVIRPYSAADKRRAQFNAFAQAADGDHATVRGGHWEDTTHAVHTGLGGGSDSVLHFSSSTWAAFEHQHAGHASGASPDEVLLHEMVHALRHMVGTREKLVVGHLYDNEEEFFAIVVANIYASETGRLIDLRADHHGATRLSENQDTSAEFLPKADFNDYRYRLIQKLVRQEPFLCLALADVPGPFNPIRRYFDLQTPAVQQQLQPLTVPRKPTPEYNDLPNRWGHSHRLAQGLFGKFGPGNPLGFYA